MCGFLGCAGVWVCGCVFFMFFVGVLVVWVYVGVGDVGVWTMYMWCGCLGRVGVLAYVCMCVWIDGVGLWVCGCMCCVGVCVVWVYIGVGDVGVYVLLVYWRCWCIWV